MSRYELAGGAAADWLEIVRYTKQNWGQIPAQRYREELDLALQQLGLTGDVGRKRDAIATGLRSGPSAALKSGHLQEFAASSSYPRLPDLS